MYDDHDLKNFQELAECTVTNKKKNKNVVKLKTTYTLLIDEFFPYHRFFNQFLPLLFLHISSMNFFHLSFVIQNILYSIVLAISEPVFILSRDGS